ncbi:MAG TPA: hypothetical protein VN802_23115 [Stellaceae bacterium]|nr:hypothetical protein [Stellaceae bacterium]
MDADEAKAKRRAEGERRSRIMWAYVCGAISIVSVVVGLGVTFIPLGFAVLGALLARGLARTGDQRHATYAGILIVTGLIVWFAYNWPIIRHYLRV